QYSNISDYAGRNVKLRFGLHSNASDEVVPGGFRIDDFIVQQEMYSGPAPRNLIAVTNDENQVELSWDALSEGGSEGWIQWDNGVNDDAIGLSIGGTMYTAASFDPVDMMPYVGGEITQVELYINDLPSSMILHVWSGPNAAIEILSQTFTATGMDWVIIDLDTPVTIESETEYWLGYEVTQTAGQFCCGVDAGPAIVEKGDWVALSPGAWQSMAGLGLNYNWNIHAYVDGGDRLLPRFTAGSREREINGYTVWRSTESGMNYQNIGFCEVIDTPYFLDEDPVAASWNYYVVTAIYDSLDGAFSNEARAYIFDDEMMELAYDDGSCEAGLNVGIAQYMAVKFTPPCNYIRILTHLNIYIETLNSGQLVFRILEGSTGLPGEMLGQFNVTPDNLHVGWNMIEIPYISIPDSTSECFFISIFEMACLAAIGKDTDTAGNSWMTTGQEHIWEEITDGNMMLRTYIEPYDDGSDVIELAPASISISCYPNPFNPQTTISFFTTEGTENTEISIYNTKGQRIREWKIENVKSKINSVVWDGKDSQNISCATGVYFCRIKAGKQTATSKILLLK
ncbi:MAG: T9SS type A sorting domain-containing protein, partial [Candidatus Stygibacter australis]|nr:T9SS type A sorting domain-containing protein [Candidatus Stygibacter australis]